MSLRGFLWRIFAWLPVCFVAWYWVAPFHAEVASWATQGILGVFEADVVDHLERAGHVLSFVTRLESTTDGTSTGVFVVDVDAVLYTFGVPLFAALMLASRGAAWALLVGTLALLPIQSAGIAMGFLVQLIGQGTNVASVTGIHGWRAECVALAYQFSSLVMPAAAAILMWCAFRRDFIGRLEWSAAEPAATA
jgi:hypothetical protein